MASQDIRWLQRFSNFDKALKKLEGFAMQGELNELEKQGLIQAFEYTFELAWKTLQDLLKFKGFENINGPKPVIQQSFQDNIIEDGDNWAQMIRSRNLSSHTYNERNAERIVEEIKNIYVKLFVELRKSLKNEMNNSPSLF